MDAPKTRNGNFLATFLTVLGIGAGAWMSTLSTALVRASGLSLMVASLVGIAVWFVFEREKINRLRLAFMVALALGGLAATGAIWWRTIAPLLAHLETMPPSTRAVFESDYKSSFVSMIQVKTPYLVNENDPVYASLHEDPGSHSGFVSFYVPSNAQSSEIASWLANNYTNILKMFGEEVTISISGEVWSSSEIRLVNRVYVYHDDIWFDSQNKAVEFAFAARGLAIESRGLEYAARKRFEQKLLH